jgi:uncharacterized protein (DUF433 family)
MELKDFETDQVKLYKEASDLLKEIQSLETLNKFVKYKDSKLHNNAIISCCSDGVSSYPINDVLSPDLLFADGIPDKDIISKRIKIKISEKQERLDALKDIISKSIEPAPVVKIETVCGGEPTIRGHRITVTSVLGWLKDGCSIKEISENLDLTEEEVKDAIQYVIEHIE